MWELTDVDVKGLWFHSQPYQISIISIIKYFSAVQEDILL